MALQTPLFDVDSASVAGMDLHYGTFGGKRAIVGFHDPNTNTYQPFRGVLSDDKVADLAAFCAVPRQLGKGGDDTATIQAAFNWAAAGTRRALNVPAGDYLITQKIAVALTGSNGLTIRCQGYVRFLFAPGIDGIAITRDYGASFVCNVGRLELVRNTATAGIGNMALLVDYNVASPQGNQGAEGLVDISAITCRGTAQANGWKWGAKLVATSSAIVNGFRSYQPNATGIVETCAAFGGTPGSNGAALWIAGAKTSGGALIFSIQTDTAGIVAVGGHIGLLTSGPVQGVFGANVCLVGNDYGHLADHVQADVAEAISIGDSATYNCAVENVRQNFVGNGQIGAGQHFRFGTTPSTWTAIHMLECNGFNVSEQNGQAALSGAEVGIWIESGQHGAGSSQPLANTASNGVAGSSPGTIFGFSIQNIAGPWLKMQGTTNKSVTGCSCNGVGAMSVDSTQNMIHGNIINGTPDVYTDGSGNVYFTGPNTKVSTLLAFNLANTAGPLNIISSGLWPSADASTSLGDFSKQFSICCVSGQYYSNKKQVVGNQQPAIANSTGTGTDTATINSILTALRTHGLIAT